MQAAGAAAGAGLLLGGAWLGGNAADLKRRRIQAIARTPGLNVGDITGESLDVMERMMPRATGIGRGLNTYAQSEIDRLLNEAIPGYGDIQKTRTQSALDFLHGQIPQDVQNQILRSSAARALTGGYAGTGAARNLTARDLGLTSLDLIGKGQSLAQGIISGTPRATPSDISGLLGLTPTQLANVRGHERDQAMQIMLQAAGLPGKTQIWGDTFTQLGGALLGGSLMGMGTGGAAPARSAPLETPIM